MDFLERKRLFSYIEAPSQENGCMEWTGYTTFKGYGRYGYDHKSKNAHREVYKLFRGEIPTKLVCDHLCRNRRCCNPSHIEIVTNKINVLRGVSYAANMARRTQCMYGHPFDKANTYFYATGQRRCKTCNRQWQRKNRNLNPNVYRV